MKMKNNEINTTGIGQYTIRAWGEVVVSYILVLLYVFKSAHPHTDIYLPILWSEVLQRIIADTVVLPEASSVSDGNDGVDWWNFNIDGPP